MDARSGLYLVAQPAGPTSFGGPRPLRPAQRATIAVDCSKGTYVRQIAADLGRATGAGAFCIELRRTGVGEFDVEQAGSPEQVAADPHGRWFRTPARALAHLPSRELTERE